MPEQFAMSIHMAVEIHGHEPGELQEARIDVAHIARMRERDFDDGVLAEPADAARHGKTVDDGRIAPRVDRAAHQDHRAGLSSILALRHQRDGGKHRHRGLAHRHHMGVSTQMLEHRDDIIDIVVEIEAALVQWDLTGIDPIGDIYIGIRQHRQNGAAQKRRIMA